MTKSVYIHIPFCKRKCKYCSFVSFENISRQFEYVQSLLEEIDYYYSGEKLETLYFGGGTPSLLDLKLLDKIIKKFNFIDEVEITLEINPDDVDLEYLRSVRKIGVNRLSIGSQTFNDDILKLIGRRHTKSQTINAVKLAQKAGFNNISLDLMYGLPTQSIDLLKKDLELILKLGVQHISTYGLKIEEDSIWGKKPPVELPDDDLQADMYFIINETLEKNNYKRYEISNFSLLGHESKHNLNYWNNNEYYGFGIASHGYTNGVRYSNHIDFESYLTKPIMHLTEHILTEEEKIEEEIFLGFRKESGIDTKLFEKKYGIDFEEKYGRILNKYIPDHIIKTDSAYKLTLDGVLMSNIILSEFI